MNETQLAESRKPSTFERVVSFVSPQYAVSHYAARQRLNEFAYDAANPGRRRGQSGGRNKNSTSQSSRAQRDRITLMWDARDLYRNMPVVRCLVNRMRQYTVAQIVYEANTGDDLIDEEYEAYWQMWAEDHADITGRTDFRGLVDLGFGGMLVDGDYGYLPVRNGEYISLQTFEADRIGDINRGGNETEPNKVGGITFNEFGRPILVDIYDRDKHAQYTFNQAVSADQFPMLIDPDTGEQMRGVSWLAPVLGKARDLYEAFEFEMGAAKWAASHAGIVYEKDSRFTHNGGGAADFDGETSKGTPTQDVIPNKILRLVKGEGVEMFPATTRPSGAFMNLIDATLRDIAMGLNVPYGFLDMRAFGGATSRLEAQQVQRTIERFQGILKQRVLNKIKNIVIANGIQMGHISPTRNWKGGSWTFGAHITADIGYQTNADLALLQNNLVTGQELAAAQGKNYEKIVRRRAREIRRLRDVAAEEQVPVELINNTLPDATSLFADLEASLAPPPKVRPNIQEAGDKVSAQVLEVIEKVAAGELPRDEAIQTLIHVYQMTPRKAEAVVPKQGSAVGEETTKKQFEVKARRRITEFSIRRPILGSSLRPKRKR